MAAMSIFSAGKEEHSLPAEIRDLEAFLARISAGAPGRDARPSFPEDPFVRLAPTGALAIPVPIGRQGRRAPFAEEWRVLRAVARADGSVTRLHNSKTIVEPDYRLDLFEDPV